MSVLEFSAAQTVTRSSRPAAGTPGPAEALVRTRSLGICGTDTAAFAGRFPFFDFPRIPGHELGLEVLAVGPEVPHLSAGDRASLIPYRNDPNSSASRAGRSNCCPRLSVIGVHEDGGLRDQPWTVPARLLQPGHELDYDQLALVEPLAIGRHAVRRALPQQGELALVIGSGPIGLACVEFLRLAGCRVLLLDLSEPRLAFARQRLGVEETVVAGDKAADRVLQLSEGRGAGLVIDATGHPGSMSTCFTHAAVGGRVIFVGVTGEEISFPHAPVFHRRELTLFASRNALPEDFAAIVEHIRNGELDTTPWITHRLPYDEVIERFGTVTDPARHPDALKVMIDIA